MAAEPADGRTRRPGPWLPAPPLPQPGPLRGRSAELGTILDTLRLVQEGTPAMVLVNGEPGIGKTALLREVSREATRSGFTVARTTAHENDRVAPLASLGPALRFGSVPLVDSADFMDLAALHEQPLWLAERLADLLDRRARANPVLLIVDDAQWCDPLTVFVLRLLPKRLLSAPIGWILAARPAPGAGPAEEIAETASPDLGAVRVDLGGLSDDAAFSIAVDRLGRRPAPDMLRRLTEARGNPFLIVQLLDGLFPAGSEAPPEQVPAGLADGVRRRTGATSESCQELLRTAAVLGEDFQLPDVAGLLGVPATRLTTPLSEAIAAGMLADDGRSVRFRHDLLREAVYADLPPSGRRVMHRAAAEYLLASGRGHAAAAPHVLATAERGDAWAADILRRAAHEILDTMSVTAVTFIRQSFELTAADDPVWGEIGADVVAVLLAARDLPGALSFADTVLSAPVAADLRARIRLLLLPGLWADGRRAEVARYAEDTGAAPELSSRLAGYRSLAAGVPAGDSGVPTGYSGADPVASVLGLLAAAEQARRDGDYSSAYESFAAARVSAHDLAGHGAPDPAALALREALALARLDGMEAAAALASDDALRASSWQASRSALLRAHLAFGAGHLGDAASEAATARTLMSELSDLAFEPQARLLAVLTEVFRGNVTEARSRLTAWRTDGEEASLAQALLADAEGDPAGTADIVALVRDGHSFPWPENLLVTAACSAHHQDDADTVRKAAGLLDRLAERNPDVASVTGASLLVRALTTGDYEPAVARLRDSPRLLLSARAAEESGRSSLASGNRDGGLAALDEAWERYARLGAAGAAARVQRILRAGGARRRRWTPAPQRPDRGWDSLTGMERRVALLIADGHTNRSAADELTLSPSTVSTHLRAVFSKLDVHSRVQLANLVRSGENAAPRRS